MSDEEVALSMQEDEYTVADESLQEADAGVEADVHEPEEEPDQPVPAPLQPDGSQEDDDVQYVGGTASDKDSVDSDPTRGLDPVAVHRVIELVAFLNPHLAELNMEQAPATFQRAFPDALRRHLRQEDVLEYFEEVAERPQDHVAAGVIRELFPDGESDLMSVELSPLASASVSGLPYQLWPRCQTADFFVRSGLPPQPASAASLRKAPQV